MDHNETGVSGTKFAWEHKPTHKQLVDTAQIVAKQKPKSRQEYDDGWFCRAEDGTRFRSWEAGMLYCQQHDGMPMYNNDTGEVIGYKPMGLFLRGHGKRPVWRAKSK